MSNDSFTVIVLAAQRAGQLDPLAAEAGVSHKCLVPIAGKPLLMHVLAALAETEGIARIRIAVEQKAAEKLAALVEGLDVLVEFSAAADNIADSVYAAAHDVSGPVVVTTADNVLLTEGAVRAVSGKLLSGRDAVVAFARKESVLAAHPEGQRRFYKFSDGEYSNCNLYGLSQRGLRLAEAFRGGGQFAHNPMRITTAVGFLNAFLVRSGLITLDRAMQRLGSRFGVTAEAVILADGAHAVDVDNERTYEVAAELLKSRLRPLGFSSV